MILASACSRPEAQHEHLAAVRNVVIVCLDTVRADVLELPETASLDDRLTPWLSEATRFAAAQSTAPWTVPAVASTLTGLYPNRHGAGRFPGATANLAETVPSAVIAQARTLPELLADAGFVTAAFVAHPWFRTGYALDRGFAALELRAESGILTEKAFTWLDRQAAASQSGEPARFLLYLHFMEAHERHRSTVEALHTTVDAMEETHRSAARALAPAGTCAAPESLECLRFLAYVDAVLELRGRVADLLDGLADRQMLQDTVVLVYSDHGEEFGDHVDEGRRTGGDPRGIYGMGHGHSLYQELLHVPLLVWHPGLPGRRFSPPVSLVDVTPSVIDWLGLQLDEPRPPWAGVAWGRLEADGSQPRPLFSSGIAYGPQQMAVRFGARKRIHLPAAGAARLYDLTDDPGERHPLEDRGLARPLDRQLSDYAQNALSGDDSAAPDIPPQYLEQLRALGYLEGAPAADGPGS